ncbi:hypothetical protein NKH80_17485 [Mesorhizobium sp. M0904]|uniref:hypothetical protein n=1 Tax=Mesorhizobium sp. M0904 TaxID=2957022 RepID=UPI003335F185
MDSVVQVLIDAVIRQGEFAASLATAVVGGCIALISWRVTQGELPQARRLRAMLLIFAAIVLMSLSIALFYLAYGNIIHSMPDFAFIDKTSEITPDQFRSKLWDAGLGDAQFFFLGQMLFFALGFVAILIFFICNYRVVQGGKPK